MLNACCEILQALLGSRECAHCRKIKVLQAEKRRIAFQKSQLKQLLREKTVAKKMMHMPSKVSSCSSILQLSISFSSPILGHQIALHLQCQCYTQATATIARLAHICAVRVMCSKPALEHISLSASQDCRWIDSISCESWFAKLLVCNARLWMRRFPKRSATPTRRSML